MQDDDLIAALNGIDESLVRGAGSLTPAEEATSGLAVAPQPAETVEPVADPEVEQAPEVGLTPGPELESGAPAPEPAPTYAAGDPSDPAQILLNRPDVLRGFYEAYYGPNNDRHSDAWANRVGEATPEAYASYWYKTYGELEGYGTTGVPIDRARILVERPDVLRGFYESYYGPGNDRHSSAWTDRVGGETPEDYAGWWYKTYARYSGYSQAPPVEPEPEPPVNTEPGPEFLPRDTPALDHGGADAIIVTVGQGLTSADIVAV